MTRCEAYHIRTPERENKPPAKYSVQHVTGGRVELLCGIHARGFITDQKRDEARGREGRWLILPIMDSQ